MKKITAILLSILCIFSLFTCPAVAGLEDFVGDLFEDEFGVTEEEGGIDQVLNYGVHYEMDTLSLVPVTYKPVATLTFKQPVTIKVTEDSPLAVDYQFVCWKEKGTGKLYYPGDPIEITGEVTLVAIWEEKTDNYPRMIRVIINSLEMVSRLINKFLGLYDIYVEYMPDTETTVPETTTVPSTTVPA